ncbi:MAG: fibronectin type III domain-containing protein, partial [Bacteroidales bacterium]|nr:fibronectin type III domain-containing protein [Bacteroidales bacterium]
MQKHLQRLLLIVAMMVVPWVTQGQALDDYTYSTGTDASKWITVPTTLTSLISPGAGDYGVSTVHNLGFSFPFGENTYTQFSVNSDGNLKLGSSVTGTSNYSTPFSSSNANVNNPKINFFGCDGYCDNSHYVRYLHTADTNGDSVGVVEFCMGTYTSSTRSYLYKWQVHLYHNGNVVVVYGVAPSTAPVVSRQQGLCVNSSDGWTISSSHVATHFTSGTSTTISSGNWPSEGRYYQFTRPVITCPKPEAITVTGVTPNSVDVEWVEADSATMWRVRLMQGSTILTDSVVTDTAAFSFTSLTANTVYTVSVASICDVDDTSQWRTATVCTYCNPVSTLPITMGFESSEGVSTGSSTSSTFVDCWFRLNNGSQYYGYPYVSSSTIYNHTPSGARGLYWYNTTTTGTYGDYQVIVLPAPDTALYPINTLQLTFWARASSTSYSPVFEVGVLSIANDISTFESVATVNVGNSTAWGEYITSFENYTGNGQFVAIRANRPSSSWYAHVDDIRLELIPDCPHVQDLVVRGITTSSATVYWDEEGTATAWTVEYGTHGFVRGTGTIITATEDSLEISGLLSATTYDVYVTPVCDTADISVENFTHFTTLCDYIDSLPFFENFESVTTGSTTSETFVPCWHRLNNATMYFGYPYVANSSSYSHNGGSKGLYWYNTTTTGTYGDYQYVVLPGVDLNIFQISDLQMMFWAKPSSTSYSPMLEIGVMTDPNDINTFVAVDTFSVSNTADWVECFVSFLNYTGDGAFVAVRSLRASSSWYVYLDEFTLEVAPPCPNVYDMNVDNVSYLGGSISWGTRGGSVEASGFEIELVPDDTTVSPSTYYTNDYSYIFTGLSTGEGYTAYVRADCGSDYSPWDSIHFSTLTLPCAVLDSATMDTIIFSNSTSTGTSGIMVYSGYGNTVSQDIYTATELLAAGLTAGPIIGVDLGFSTNSSYAKEFTIMMSNTSKQTFSSSTDMENMANHTLVYGPAPHPLNTSGWQHYSFDQAFEWDGSSNIIITFFMNQPAGASHSSSSFNGYYTSGSGTRHAYRYQDGTAYNTTNYTGGSSGGTGSSRPSIHFYTGECLEYASCIPSSAWISSNDTNGVELSWLASYMEDTWDLDYREVGTTRWINEATGVSTNNYLFTGLTPLVNYELRLSHYCNDSLYSTIVPVRAYGLSYNMSTSGTDTFYVCGAAFYDNGGPEGNYSNSCSGQMVIYPLDSTNSIRIEGIYTGEGCCDYLGIYDGVGTSGRQLFYGCSPSGGQVVNIGPFTSDSGPITITFSSDGSVVYPGFELFTRCIPPPQCSEIVSITPETVGTQAANVSWMNRSGTRFGEPAGFEYILYDSIGNIVSHDSTIRYSNFFTGLTTESQYTLKVRTICQDGEHGPWDSVMFTTVGLPCAVYDTSSTVTRMFSNGTSTQTGVFVSSAWGNSFCQSIYTAQELADAGISAGEIIGVTLGYSSTASYNKDLSIFLTATNSRSTFNSSSEYVPIDGTMLVYGPATHLSSTTGWVNYTFDNSFYWDGVSNLVLTTFMNQPSGSSHSSSGFYAYNTDCGVTRTVYRYRDSSPWTVDNYSSGSSSTSTYRPSITFFIHGCSEPGTCAAPTVIVDSIDHDVIALRWNPGYTETSWRVEYKTAGDSTWISMGTTSSDTMTLTGLTADMDYNIRVISLCSDTNLARNINAHTPCAPTPLPFFEDFETWTSSSGIPLPACWYGVSDYSSTYPYVTTSYSVYPGTKSMYFYRYNNTHTYLVLPVFDAPIDSLNLSFWIMRSNTSYTHSVKVGVMKDPNDFNTFVQVGYAAPTTTFEPYEFDLSSYHGTGRYIAICTGNDDNYSYPYIDNIQVDRITSATCSRPDSLRASNPTMTSVDLHWRERGTATQWVIEYGPVGFQRGTGTSVLATTNPYTLTGLPSSFDGEYFVRSLCDNGDTSLYSCYYPCRFSTLQLPATIPYTCTFEDSTEWAAWQTSTNSTIDWARGTAEVDSGNYAMYISPDGGLTYGNEGFTSLVNAAIFRDVDFGTVDSSFTLTYRAKMGGSTDGRYDALMVFLVDASVQPTPSTTAITSPWGNVNDLYRISLAYLDTTWNTYTASFDTIHGVKRVAFFWFNQNTAANHPFIGGPAAVDNIHIDYSSCPRPVNLDTVTVTNTTATLHWDGAAAANYRVAYRVAGAPASTNVYVNTSTNSVTLTGLDPQTTYRAWVQKLCGTDSSLFSDGVEFQTEMCADAATALGYDPSWSTTTSSYGPIGYSFYNYSYVQTLIDSAQMAGMTDPISAMEFNPVNGNQGSYYTNMDIYLANVSESDLSSGFIMPDANHQFVQMTNGADLSYSDGGWHIVGFDTTFTWDGHSNVLVAVNRRHGSYSSGASFNAHTTTGIKTRYLYQDGSAYDPSTVSGGTTASYVGDLRFISCGSTPVCHEPIITGVSHTYESATVTWTGDANAYEVNIKESVAPSFTNADIPVVGNSHTFYGLQPATSYTFRVRTDCTGDSLGYSDWVLTTVTTDSLPCLPPDSLTVTDITNTNATFDWVPFGYETMWSLRVWNTADFDTTYTVSSHPVVLSGFTAG